MTFRQIAAAGALAAFLFTGAAQAQGQPSVAAQGSSGKAGRKATQTPAGRRSAHPTTSDTAMDTSGSGVVSVPTGPETSTPDTQGTSDLTGSTGPSIPLGTNPAPPSPAPPGGAPSGGQGPH